MVGYESWGEGGRGQGGGVGAGQGKTMAVEDVLDYGVEKKKKKAGGFGDFSGW